LPHAYRDTTAGSGRAVTIEITGPAGGIFTLLHDGKRWTLLSGQEASEAARATLSDDNAWRLLFNALPSERAGAVVTRTGDAALLAPLLKARSVIV
jgi:hypothetical protein